MIDRSKYDNAISQLETIASHYEGKEFHEKIAEIKQIVQTFDIKLIFTGHFNGGKSALLNSLLGMPEYLTESQTPETALATELYYDSKELKIAHLLDETMEIMEPTKDYSIENCESLEYHIPSKALNQVSDFTLVDTPGFDSGFDAHNRALSSYIGKGSVYFVVIDQEKGGIDNNSLNYIKEVSNYSNNIVVLMNKCDKIMPEVATKIVEGARNTLAFQGFNYPVLAVSKKEDNISEKLIGFIHSFDAQEMFDQIVCARLQDACFSMKKIVEIIEAKLFVDTFDLNKEIAQYEQLDEKIRILLEKEEKELKKSITPFVDTTMDRIREALCANSAPITDVLLLQNQVAAQAIVMETIRPVILREMQNVCHEQMNEVVHKLDFTGLMDPEQQESLTEISLHLAKNLKDLIERGAFEKEKSDNFLENDQKKTVYRGLAGFGAVATSVIAPWLEIAIILAPDIIKLVQGLFSESNEEKLEKKFQAIVIPQICSCIYPSLCDATQGNIDFILDQFQTQMSLKLDSIKDNLLDAQTKKTRCLKEFDAYKANIAHDIALLDELYRKFGGNYVSPI